MKRDSLLKPLLLALGIALLVYVTFYTAIERRRNIKGPWEVTFASDISGVPSIQINQTTLGITNVQIRFVGTTNSLGRGARKLNFAEARAVPFDVPAGAPFGQCVFLDTTFLPGTVVFDLFGHEIQVLPRVLTIDRAERAWRPGEIIELTNRQPVATGK